jgi:LmbE family N-acetylglucosaminyl deacetylase
VPTLLAVFAHPDDETFGPGGTLAKYAASGVEVHYVCATKGEAGEAPADLLQRFRDMEELRATELECASRILGIKQVHFLGYRDSGMPGSEDNLHPRSLQQAAEEEVVGKIVALIRQIRPEVVITFDPRGGYGHPDHVKIHRTATEAFFAAGHPDRFGKLREQGLSPHQPQYLYYTAFSRRVLKFWLFLLPLIGKDPSRYGLNQDIDLRRIAEWSQPIHARINVRPYLAQKLEAAACHRSQMSAMRDYPIPNCLRTWLMGVENFTRAYPPVEGRGRLSRDLFAGISG